MRYKFRVLLITLIFMVISSSSIYAHPGRTDSSGGHNDKSNSSGLGSYHFHHGQGPHLHPGGICELGTNSFISILQGGK